MNLSSQINPLQDLSKNEGNSQKMKYQSLVLSGGGIKGISYCGALEVLEEKGILKGITNFAGTSAGAIVAAFLAVGYNVKEIYKIMNDMNMRDVIDDKSGIIRDGINLVESCGVAPGKSIMKLLGKLIMAKTLEKDYTINQLFRDKGIRLVIVGTDITTESSKYFYPNDSPTGNIPIRKAVRISMGIPFVFVPVLHENNLHIDGGVLDNYPLHVFDGEYPGDPNARLDLCPIKDNVLGLRITVHPQGTKNDITGLLSFGMSIISTFMSENNRRMLTSVNLKRTIQLVTPDYPVTYFDVSESDKKTLIDAGKQCTMKFFK